MQEKLEKEIGKLVADAAGVSEDEAKSTLESPKNNFGDIASTVSFMLAKRDRKSPVQIAKELEGKIGKHAWVKKVQAVGPYLNFFLSDGFYSQAASEVVKEKSRFGAGKKKKGSVLIEFPSVNPNKPWHIGHLRNAVLGDCAARLLLFAGNDVERQDYIDDLGLQVAESLWGYLNLKGKPEGKFDHWVGKEYVEVEKLMADEKVKGGVRNLLKEMEEGNKKVAGTHKELVEACVKAQYETAFKLKIYHDLLIKESAILKEIYKEGMEVLSKSPKIIHEKEGKNIGCLVAKMEGKEFEGMESPDMVLVRSDGTATYTGKDVIFHLWKFGKLKGKFKYSQFIKQPNGKDCFITSSSGKEMEFKDASSCINVIGMEQAYPQKVVKEVLRTLGYGKEADSLHHLSYEHAALPEGKFSGRQGTWIGFTADELIDEGIKRAGEKITKEMDADEKEKVAHEVAIGAIRFSFVSKSPEKRIIFEWDRALSMEGDSAPYLQYAHARMSGINEKAGGELKAGKGKKLDYAYTDEEKALLKLILQFPKIAQNAALDIRPHRICEYTLDLAACFNKFYNTSPILKSEGDEKEARIRILLASKYCLANCLSILGIEALEGM